MSVLVGSGGSVPSSGQAATFFTNGVYPASVDVRVMNTTSNPIEFLMTMTEAAQGQSFYRAVNQIIPANAPVEIERGLKMLPGASLANIATAAGLYWTVTGMQDDGN